MYGPNDSNHENESEDMDDMDDMMLSMHPTEYAPGQSDYDKFYVVRELRKAGLWHSDEDVACDPMPRGESISVEVFPATSKKSY